MNGTEYFRRPKGLVADSTNTVRRTVQQIIYDYVNSSITFYPVRESIQPMYDYRND